MKLLYVEIDGERLTVKQASEKYGIRRGTIVSRISKGCKGIDIVKPVHVVPEFICRSCGSVFKSSPSNKNIYCSLACVEHVGPKRHGESYTRLHKLWCGMRARSRGGNSVLVKKYYRDRGITCCEEWDSYEAFRDWALAHGYADDLELDRIDNDKGYSPSNCRWATRRQQMANTRKRSDPRCTSKYKGVSFCRSTRLKWRALGNLNGKPIQLGLFETEAEAARAYDLWASDTYGEYASLNFPQEHENNGIAGPESQGRRRHRNNGLRH